MHSLEVIEHRNIIASARALNEAEKVGDWERAGRILAAAPNLLSPEWPLFAEAYVQAYMEG